MAKASAGSISDGELLLGLLHYLEGTSKLCFAVVNGSTALMESGGSSSWPALSGRVSSKGRAGGRWRRRRRYQLDGLLRLVEAWDGPNVIHGAAS
ncbi:hypothetical protein [Streptomyces sp. NPDC001828]|uniref:hypothetical protein n=1 Tax=Streptomyces sp. NPDC001828 TaxID=3364615 RepID=UPI003681BD22